MSSFLRSIAVFGILCSLSANSYAFDRDGVARPDLEFRRLSKPSDTIGALGNDLLGEQVDHYSGQTSFYATDIALPGNSNLAVALSRSKAIQESDGYQPALAIGDWDIDVPVLEGIFSSAKGWVGTGPDPTARCSQGNGRPPDYTTPEGGFFQADEYWQGYQIKIPGQGSQDMLLSNAQTQNRATPARWATKNRWIIECLPTLKSGGTGEGFVATDPNGTKYFFDRMVTKTSQPFKTKIKRHLYSIDTYLPGGTCTSSYVSSLSCYYELPYGSLNMMDGGGGGTLGCALTDNGNPLAYEEFNYSGGSTSCTEGYSGQSNVYETLFRVSIHLLATRVQDKFGNWVDYEYSADNKLTAIRSNDGRVIQLSYGSDHAYPISASANGRIWNYFYDTQKRLNKVTQADGRSWEYSQIGEMYTAYSSSFMSAENPYNPCTMHGLSNFNTIDPGVQFTYFVTHPSGAKGEFTFNSRLQGKSNAPNCDYLAIAELSLVQKKISGAGVSPAVWSFSYGPENSSTQTKLTYPDGTSNGLPNDCTTMACITTVNTHITNPDGTQQKLIFGTRFDVNDGQLQESILTKNAITLRKDIYQYVSKDPVEAGFATKVGENPKMKWGSILSEYVLPQKKRTIEQDGTAFTWQANEFDPFGRATDITRFSSLGYSKTELATYHDNKANWTLGQLASIADVDSGKIEVFRNFDPVSALITSQLEFGQPVGTYTWNADGTLAIVKDGKNNATTFANYYRGIPQRITYADASFETGVVNENGWITSMTDVRTNTTGFAYDALGRLTKITPPAGDTVAWNSTDISFAKLATPAYGLPAGGWKQSISRGNYRKETYLDAMWRPVVTREYDNSNVEFTQRFTRHAYDTQGRTIFASYPGKGDLNSDGIRTEYDGLGRVTKTMQDSELGLLTSSTEYLTGFKTKTINPRGYFSLTSYMAWDSPDMSLPTRIESAEDTLTVFNRDGFGKPLSVTRSSLSDSSITGSRTYAYDAQQRLCQRTEPESGSTVMSYDAAGNMLWSAPGQSVANPNACDLTAVPSIARITRSYDVLNRLKTVDVPNSTNDLSYTYSGGLLQTLSNGGVVWNYAYNKLGLPTTETLTLEGITKTIAHRYDANGVEDQLTLPSGLAVGYSPNALSQATQAGTFATGGTYRSNGSVAGFVYGNGIVHKQLPNMRGLPAVRQDLKVNELIFDENTAFDETGNVMCIRDYTSGNGGHRDMQYDGLDRLIGTYAKHQAWITSEYVYDALDNLRFNRLGSRRHSYIYNAQNRLSAITRPETPGPGPTDTGTLSTCTSLALAADMGTLSAEGSGTTEPTPGTTTPPSGGGTGGSGGGTGGGTCTDPYDPDCGGGGGVQQQKVVDSNSSPATDHASPIAKARANEHANLGEETAARLLSGEMQTTSVVPDVTAYSFTYDANGNMTSGRQAIQYDALNRVVEVTGKESYLYDGHGRRVKTKRLSDNKTNYSVYSLGGQLVTEDDARTNKKKDYIHFSGRLVAQRSAALTGTTAQTTTYINSYLHTDSLGSPIVQTNQTGTPTKVERYTPYGEPSDQGYDQGPGFTGHVTDAATGLTYMQQRYYDPAIGRFLSVDPMASDMNNGWNFNRYNYAANNPYRFTDPDGRACDSLDGGGCGSPRTSAPVPHGKADERAGKIALGVAGAAAFSAIVYESIVWAVSNPAATYGLLSDIAIGDTLGGASLVSASTAVKLSGSGHEMFLTSKSFIASAKVAAKEKIAAFDSMAARITEETRGSWSATKSIGADGSTIYSGDKGGLMVIDSKGSVYSGRLSAETLPASNIPNYEKLRKD